VGAGVAAARGAAPSEPAPGHGGRQKRAFHDGKIQTDGISQGTVVGTVATTSNAPAPLWIYKKQDGPSSVSAQLLGTSMTASGQFTF
jgi:hypothetical protein